MLQKYLFQSFLNLFQSLILLLEKIALFEKNIKFDIASQ